MVSGLPERAFLGPTAVIDLHEDLLPYLEADGLGGSPGQTSFDMLEAARVRVVAATTFPLRDHEVERLSDPGMDARIERWLRRYHEVAADRPGWRIVRDAAGLDACLDEDEPRGLLLTVEGLVVDEQDPWPALERWHELGWRVCCLMWNESSPLGGGTFDPDRGLTALGAEVVDWLAERRIALDLSHASRATFRDAAERWPGPLLVSHANAHELAGHPRNLERWQLDLIRESGGLVGVVLLDKFVTEDPSAASVTGVADHVLHLLDAAGERHVGIGTDFGGLGDGIVPGLEGLDRLGALWEELDRRGVGGETIELIAWRNGRRVLAAML